MAVADEGAAPTRHQQQRALEEKRLKVEAELQRLDRSVASLSVFVPACLPACLGAALRTRT